MKGPAYIPHPLMQELSQLIEQLAKGELLLPPLQRSPVWSDEQRLRWLQSICDGIPIGSALVWRTDREDMQALAAIGPHPVNIDAWKERGYRSYLLDGSHRFSTLVGFLRPLPAGRAPFVESDDGEMVSWRAGFDLEEEQFTILEPGEIAAPTWVPSPLLLDSLELLQFQRELPDSRQRERWLQRSDAVAETFRTYVLPVVPLVTDDLAIVTRAFARVDDRGPLRAEMELTRAALWTSSFDLEEKLATVRERLVEVGWESLETEWVFAVCKVLAGFDPSDFLDDVREKLRTEPEIFDRAAEKLGQVAEWLAASCGVGSPRIIPHRRQLTTLVEKLGDPNAVELVKWFWQTSYAEEGGSPDFEVPAGFPIASARVRTLALRLAAQNPLDLDGTPLAAERALADHGASALLPISPSLRGCAGRVFTRSGSALREALVADATAISPEVLSSHAITVEAAVALAARDYAGFLKLRAAEIRRLEESFYAQTQSVT